MLPEFFKFVGAENGLARLKVYPVVVKIVIMT